MNDDQVRQLYMGDNEEGLFLHYFPCLMTFLLIFLISIFATNYDKFILMLSSLLLYLITLSVSYKKNLFLASSHISLPSVFSSQIESNLSATDFSECLPQIRFGRT